MYNRNTWVRSILFASIPLALHCSPHTSQPSNSEESGQQVCPPTLEYADMAGSHLEIPIPEWRERGKRRGSVQFSASKDVAQVAIEIRTQQSDIALAQQPLIISRNADNAFPPSIPLPISVGFSKAPVLILRTVESNTPDAHVRLHSLTLPCGF